MKGMEPAGRDASPDRGLAQPDRRKLAASHDPALSLGERGNGTIGCEFCSHTEQ